MSALAFPSIWTPPKWLMPWTINSDGKWGINSQGKWSTSGGDCDECCEEDEPTECHPCVTGQSQIEVTFAGVQKCICANRKTTTSININGTYIVSSVGQGGPTRCLFDVPFTAIVDVYDNDECENVVVDGATNTGFVRIAVDEDCRVTIGSSRVFVTPIRFYSVGEVMTSTLTANCDNNANQWAYGGTAIVHSYTP